MIETLVKKIKETQAPIVVGLDPNLNFVPEFIKEKAFREAGESLEGAALAFKEYNKGIIDSIADLVPAVKPQVAMYEQLGIPGMEVFEWTVDYAHKKGLVVIGDIKRGDIGSTSEMYAVGHIGKTKIGSNLIPAFDEDMGLPITYMAFQIDHNGPYVAPGEAFDHEKWLEAEGPRRSFGHQPAPRVHGGDKKDPK